MWYRCSNRRRETWEHCKVVPALLGIISRTHPPSSKRETNPGRTVSSRSPSHWGYRAGSQRFLKLHHMMLSYPSLICGAMECCRKAIDRYWYLTCLFFTSSECGILTDLFRNARANVFHCKQAPKKRSPQTIPNKPVLNIIDPLAKETLPKQSRIE